MSQVNCVVPPQVIPAGLRPIAEAPRDRPVLGYTSSYIDPVRRYVVVYHDAEHDRWYTVHGRDFVIPTHFKEL